MKGHPGGLENTRRMVELAGLFPQARILDLGAGAGETVALLHRLGYQAQGIDLEPRSPLVEQGNLLCTHFPAESFDALFSQCAFYASGDPPKALAESHRILKPGGKLLLADVFFQDPAAMVARAGFSVLYAVDMTPAWREYYIEALWREENVCPSPGGRCSYWLLICGKE